MESYIDLKPKNAKKDSPRVLNAVSKIVANQSIIANNRPCHAYFVKDATIIKICIVPILNLDLCTFNK